MQNRKMKKVVAIMMVAATIGIVSGCGKKAEKCEVTTTVTDTQESDVTVNEAAIDQVFNHIEVNGVHVDFPFSLNDLGDDYDFANYVDMGDGTFGMELRYNGNDIATAYVKANSESDVNRESAIEAIYILETDNQMIKVNNIDCNSELKDVEQYFDKLTIDYNEDGSAFSTGYTDDSYYFKLYFVQGNKVEYINLAKK